VFEIESERVEGGGCAVWSCERVRVYRGTSLTRTCTPLGPYRGPMPRVLRGSWGGGRFLMGEVPL